MRYHGKKMITKENMTDYGQEPQNLVRWGACLGRDELLACWGC